jgi:hypothetical protein
MKTVVISASEIRNEFPNVMTYEELFRCLEQKFSLSGEVVCAFKVNGLTLTEAMEGRVGAGSIDEIKILEVQTDVVSNLLVEVMQSWLPVIPEMTEKIDQLSQKIRSEGITGNLQHLVKSIDDCQLLIDSVISIGSVLGQHPIVKSEIWTLAESKTAAAVGEALQSFQNKDFVTLSDVLEYDLAHSLNQWHENFVALSTALVQSQSHEIPGAEREIQSQTDLVGGG